MTDGMPSIIDNIVPRVVAKDIEINPSTTEWMIDPIQSYTMQLKRQKLPIFAEALNRNLTGLYFQFLQYKVKLNENVSIECKGVTRSGKTTGMISSGKYIAKFTHVPFTVRCVCPNEQYFIDSVKVAIDNQSLVIDEQLETHVGIGSYREMQYIEDLNNIIAKKCIHCFWIHPPEFVGRNSFYGLETIGRNFEFKLTRFLLYDLTQKSFGASSVPLGFVIIPKYNDKEFEDAYEKQKDIHIENLRSENIAVRQQRRLDEGFALARNPLFKRLKNNTQRVQVARNLFPMRTEGEYMELVSIARMNSDLNITQEDFDEAKSQIAEGMKPIADDELPETDSEPEEES
jgi:hypothetical protein